MGPEDSDQRQRVNRNLRVAQWSGLLGAALGGLANFAAGERQASAVLAVACAAFAVCAGLRRRGWIGASAVAFLASLVATVQALALVGLKAHDTAIALYPVAILVAALMFDRRLLAGTTLACVVSYGSVVYVGMPGRGSLTDALPFVDVSIIIVVTAVAVHLLLEEVVGSVAEARAGERRLAAAYRQLEAKNTELERFTYAVSHDLKSPLVTIRGFLGYVEEDARGGNLERLGADVERIRTATDRMGRLLDELLELSRVGRVARPFEEVPFGEIVRESRALVEGRLAARDVKVEVEEELGVVWGDRARLVELMQNLLDNAAKFMGRQEAPRVVVGARTAPGEPGGRVYYVRDNGSGIEPEYHDRVFELFCRLDPRGEGTGVGLALARRIVETHGGHIWVESEGRDRGSALCFTLAPKPSDP
jgi:signal transduction histidine kinase